MSFSAAILFAFMTTAEAVSLLLNSPSACSPDRYAAAYALVGREAAKGQPLQQYVIGVLRLDEKRANGYLDEARPVIQRLAEEKGNPLAWYLISLERNDLRMLTIAAKGGNVQALNALGTLSTQEIMRKRNASSNEVAQVLSQSFDCFKRAAAKNDANGFVNLGACYLNGLGCERDLAMAFTCFKSAADLGHPEGMDSLSAAYSLGHGVERDMEKAAVWRMRAKAVRGDEAARKWVADRKRLKDAK